MLGRARRFLGRLLAWLRPGDGSTDEADDGDSGSIWGLTPSWQYDGLHVESGGMTRDGQETTLREIEAEAERQESAERERTR